jgi:hypothetical protein
MEKKLASKINITPFLTLRNKLIRLKYTIIISNIKL